MRLRKVVIDDLALLVKLGLDYLSVTGGALSPTEELAVIAQLERYFRKHILNNRFLAMLAEENNNIMSAAYMAISEKPAIPSFITGVSATLLNALTYPAYRRGGIVAKIIEKIIYEAKALGVSSISLSATEQAKTLYEN